MRSQRAPPPHGFWCLVCHRGAVWLCQSHLESLGLFSEACIPLGRRWFETFRSRTLMGLKNVPFRTSPPPGSTSKSSDWVRQMPSYPSIPCQWCLGLAVIAVCMPLVVIGLAAPSGHKQVISIPVHNSLKTSHCFRVKTKSLLWPQLPGRIGLPCCCSVSSHVALSFALCVPDTTFGSSVLPTTGPLHMLFWLPGCLFLSLLTLVTPTHPSDFSTSFSSSGKPT